MSPLTVEFPESLFRSIAALAKEEGYSIDQFLASAAAEKLAAFKTLDFLREEAAKGSRADFESFLANVPQQKPAGSDTISDSAEA